MSSMFSGTRDRRTNLPPPPPVVNAPVAAAPKREEVKVEGENPESQGGKGFRSGKGRESTILTGGRGDESEASLLKKKLLGN